MLYLFRGYNFFTCTFFLLRHAFKNYSAPFRSAWLSSRSGTALGRFVSIDKPMDKATEHTCHPLTARLTTFRTAIFELHSHSALAMVPVPSGFWWRPDPTRSLPTRHQKSSVSQEQQTRARFSFIIFYGRKPVTVCAFPPHFRDHGNFDSIDFLRDKISVLAAIQAGTIAEMGGR